MARLLTCSLLAICALTACGPGPAPDDGGTPPADGGPGVDAALDDAGPVDAGMRMRTTAAGPTGATCPDGSAVTYDSFAQGFFGSYCVRCHASTLTGGARNGAPPDVNLDSHAAITPAIAARIDRVAAAGPTRINIFMPLSGAAPTDAERDRLGEWIACGTP